MPHPDYGNSDKEPIPVKVRVLEESEYDVFSLYAGEINYLLAKITKAGFNDDWGLHGAGLGELAIYVFDMGRKFERSQSE